MFSATLHRKNGFGCLSEQSKVSNNNDEDEKLKSIARAVLNYKFKKRTKKRTNQGKE